jgi:putative SOS response-associated peptidase YedK
MHPRSGGRASEHWRGRLELGIAARPPATSFCEYADTKPRKTPTWFALSEERPLFAFAGLWTRWRGVRGPKSAPVESEHELFGFLTTEPNSIVAPIHLKAMPVILTTAEEFDLWLEGETVEALKLQRPLPDGMLDIVATGEKEDLALAV